MALDDRELFSGLNVLGHPVDLRITGTSSTPNAGGASVPAPAGPSGTGTSTGGFVSKRGPATSAPSSGGGSDLLASLAKALGVSETLLKAAKDKFGGNLPAGPSDVPAGQALEGTFTDPRFPGMKFPNYAPDFIPSETAQASLRAGFSTPAESISAQSASQRGAGALSSADVQKVINDYSPGQTAFQEGNSTPSESIAAESASTAKGYGTGETPNPVGRAAGGAMGAFNVEQAVANQNAPTAQRVGQGVQGATQIAAALGADNTYLPYVGIAANIGAEAAAGQKPAWEQALDAAFQVAGQYFGGPAGEVGAQFAMEDLARVAPDVEKGNIGPVLLNAVPLVSPIEDIGSLFGADVFGLNPAPRAKVQLPGMTSTLNQTQGGARTTATSYGEGIAGANAFTNALNGINSPAQLASVLNGTYSTVPGEFVINATNSRGEGISNVARNANYKRGFTEADLNDPAVLSSLRIYAGVTGAPAEQPQLADAIRQGVKQMQAQQQARTQQAQAVVNAPATTTAPATPAASVSPGVAHGAMPLDFLQKLVA